MRRLRTWRSTMLLSATKSGPPMAPRISSPGPPRAIDDVDLHLAELDRGNDRPIGPRRPTADDDGPSEQLLGREGHRQDVVDPEIERLELGLQVAGSRETQDRRHT